MYSQRSSMIENKLQENIRNLYENTLPVFVLTFFSSRGGFSFTHEASILSCVYEWAETCLSVS